MKITETEKDTARFCVAEALRGGAGQARATLSKSVSDTLTMLDGSLDKVVHTADSSIYMYLYVDGRYGTYSTNRLDRSSLAMFISKCLAATRLLAEDRDYRLPAKELCATDAVRGDERETVDAEYMKMTDRRRLDFAMSFVLPSEKLAGDGWKVASYESEYSDSMSDSFMVDSNGCEFRTTDTIWSVSCDLTIEGADGNRYNAFSWDATPFLAKLDAPEKYAMQALERAIAQMNPKASRGGHRKMVVDSRMSSRLFAPIVNSLYGDSLFQKNSFLCDTLGKKVFPEMLTVRDTARRKGMGGSRLYDSEGVATKDIDIISKGVVSTYYITTYYSSKLGLPQTVSGPSVPTVEPCSVFGEVPEKWDREAIIKAVGNGILVTGFNGGNCNDATGDFSYGIEGFTIKGGRIDHPVKNMLITGNIKDLWNHLLAAGNDPLSCTMWQIPTLAFADVSFSA